MRILTYRHLDPTPVQASYDRVVQALSNGDLRSPDVKKLVGHPYYRAKLSDTHRLLLSFHRYRGETVCLLLDVILNHQYQKSRFLRGAVIREEQIEASPVLDDVRPGAELRYLHPSNPSFHLLEKPMSFDDAQDAVYHLPLPLVLVGSAGSGKTALTLERLRALPGKSAYVTLSPYLARQAERLYLTGGAGTSGHRTAFLSISEVVESLGVPRGQEVSFSRFRAWFARHQTSHRQIDAHTLYEEIRGVLTGAPTGPLTLEAYLALGVRQSLYPQAERPDVHALFVKYCAWLNTDTLHDPNLAAFARLPLAKPVYDALVVDEVQDVTPVQLALLTRLLRDPSQLLICGDANQVVHPNFFSWAAVRALFREEKTRRQDVSVLSANYRNAREITRVANRLLALRVARFGSIDRESSVPAEARTDRPGRIETLDADPAVLEKLNEAVRRDVDFAVIVLRDEDKAQAATVFQTPLIFSAQEAKGLEYRGVILYDLIGGQRQTYAEIAGNLLPEDLDGEADFNRAGDKSDKAGERYKFYLNALYVALTRGIEEVIMVEQDADHPLLRLLGLADAGNQVRVQAKASSARDWADEARKLQAQGKTEQAEAIFQDVLAYKPVPWEVLDGPGLYGLEDLAMEENSREKNRRAYVEFNVWHLQADALRRMNEYEPADRLSRDVRYRIDAHIVLREKVLAEYSKKNFKSVLWATESYGIDHRTPLNATPLMLAAAAGNVPLIEELLRRGADPELTDQFGQTALMYALSRAMIDNAYAAGPFAAVYDRLAPAFVDVQVEGRLLRLERGQPEYGVLLRMLASMKSMTYSVESPDERPGIDAGDLTLDTLQGNAPADLLLDDRTIWTVMNHHEIGSDAPDSGKLWTRQGQNVEDRTADMYLPNPDLYLRVREDQGHVWVPIEQAAGWYHTALPRTFEYSKPAAVLDFPARRSPEEPLPRLTPTADAPIDLSTRTMFPFLYRVTGTVRQIFEGLLNQTEAVDPAAAHQPVFAGLEVALPRAFEAVTKVRLAIPDDNGHLSVMLDDGSQVMVAGALAPLSDAALRVLISWQAWRELDITTEVVQELRDHGFAKLAERLLHSTEQRPPREVMSYRSPHFPNPPRRSSEVASLLDASQEPRDAEISETTRKRDEAVLAGPIATFDVPAEMLEPAIDKLQEAVDRDDERGSVISIGFNTFGQSVTFSLISGMRTVFAEISGPSTPSGVAIPFTDEQQALLRTHLWTGPSMEDDLGIEDGLELEGDRQYTFARNFALNAHRVKVIVRHSVGLALSVFPHDGRPLALKVLL